MRHRFTLRGMRRMLLLALLAADKGLAGGVHFDGSLGPAGALSGPNYLIPAEAGKQAGGNLFHSFSQFDLSSGESASFLGPTNPNAAAVTNIIARITSGSASSLDGTIRSEISGANLYLVNPSGFVFGPHVSLDISGSFTATSASTVKLADGAHFDAHPGAGDLLLSAAPVSAFGFLPSAGAITVGNANDLPLHTNLSVPTGKGLSLLGGNLSLVDANLSAPSGQVALVSTASACTIGANLRVSNPHGKINLNHSTIAASGTTGGKLVIRGGSLVVNDAQLVSNTEGPGAGSGIDIHVTGKATLLANGIVLTETSGAGKAGNVTIRAGSLTLASNALVSSLALGSATAAARAGHVSVTTGDLSVSGESFISTGTNGLARGGTIDVFAQNISLAGDATQNLTGIFSNAGVPPDSGVANSNRLHTGPGGDVNIHATSLLSITNSAFIANNTYGLGAGGNVNVTAGEIILSGNGTGTRTGIFAEGRDGQSGSVNIETQNRLAIINGAAVAADTIGLGQGGSVTVTAGDLFIAALGNATKTGIFADTDSLGAGGPGGKVDIRANSILIADGGLISTKTLGLGTGGDTQVEANDLVIDRGSSPFFTGIAADSPLSGGHGGNVNVFSAMLTIRNGGQISASTGAGGDGGSVFVQATNLFLLGSSNLFTGIVADSLSTGAGGRGGDVTVLGDTLEIRNGARISANTDGSGAGGNVTVTAHDLTIANSDPSVFTGITAATLGAGRGGRVIVHTDSANLRGVGGISATASSSGAGGDVTIDADASSLGGGASITASSVQPTGPAGNAGSITMDVAGSLELSGSSSISSTSVSSNAGTVSVSASSLTLNGSSVTVDAPSSNAGQITLAVHRQFNLFDSQLLAAAGNTGGDITVDPTFLVLRDSTISANAEQGRGGNIFLAASFYFNSQTPITATGQQSGTVDVEAPELDLTNGLVTLPGSVIDANAQIREQCARRLGLDFSSFLVLGRGSVGIAPDEGLWVLGQRKAR